MNMSLGKTHNKEHKHQTSEIFSETNKSVETSNPLDRHASLAMTASLLVIASPARAGCGNPCIFKKTKPLDSCQPLARSRGRWGLIV